MHQDAVGRDEAPLQKNSEVVDQRVPFKKCLVVEPYDVIVFDVMSKMFGANVLDRAVAGAADPSQTAAELLVMSIDGKDGVVGALVDHVGGDDHAVPEQDDPGDKSRPATAQE